MTSDGKIPKGLLLKGLPAIKDAFKEFDVSYELDKDSNKFPKHLLK